MLVLHERQLCRTQTEAQVRHRTLGFQIDPRSRRIGQVQAHHDRGDASSVGIRTLAHVEGHAHVCQVLCDCRRVLQELRQGVRYQQEVITLCLYQGWHSLAGIPLGFAGKASQKGHEEKDEEHGPFRTARPQAPMEADTRSGAMRGDDAHCGTAAKGLEDLDELLRNPHVAQEESQCPMRGCVEALGDMKGQDMILLPSPLQSALGQKHRSRRRLAWHGAKLPVFGEPLTSQACREPPDEGRHKHSHVLLPQRYRPVRIQVPRGRALGHEPYDGLMPRFRDFRTMEHGPVGVYHEPLYRLGDLRDKGSCDPIGPRRLVIHHGLLHGVLEAL